MSRPVALRRSASFSLVLATSLVAWPSLAVPAAAADPDWFEPVSSPTRSGEVKGSGQQAAAEPTGRLIVRYAEGTSDADRGRVRASSGLELVGEVALPNTELVEPAGAVAGAITRLGAHAAIEYVEPEYRRARAAGPTTEAYFGQQWALHNTGQIIEGYQGVPDVDMNVPEAWEITTGSPSLVVAVLDDGVDFTHPDLSGRQWVNPGEIAGNLVDDDGNGFVDDVNGWDFCNGDNTVHDGSDSHGTHVAGSIAASGNGVGIAGVAPTVKIMSVKFISDDPLCSTDSQAAAAIAYAGANGATIINASWGAPGESSTLATAIANVPDVLVVAAAGNNNQDSDLNPFYPAGIDLPNVLSVAAIHNEGFLTDLTNFGYETVDLSAPGEDILSSHSGSSWVYRSGTSMSAAHASGVAALAASAKPALLGDAPALRQHLIATAKALPSTLFWVASPRLLDARAAVVSRPDIRRLSGANRYATAAAISSATFTPHVPYLFIATGLNFPDALAGGALAAQLGSPLLLVQTNTIPSATLAEIQRLQPQRIFVLGSAGVVSEFVANQLNTHAPTERLAGPNRYATAVAASSGWEPGVPNVFIATGANFPDALAGVPASAALGGPLLLTAQNSVPPETRVELERLNPARVVILGSNGVVSDAVASQIGGYAGAPVVRLFGANRFATAAAVSVNVFPTAETALVASGTNFPDALAGGPTGGAFLGPLLLSTAANAQTPTLQELQRLQPARIFILGGPTVVEQAVINQINALFP